MKSLPMKRFGVLGTISLVPILFIIVFTRHAAAYSMAAQPEQPVSGQSQAGPYEAQTTYQPAAHYRATSLSSSCDIPQNPIVNCSFETGDFTNWLTDDLSSPFWPLGVYTGGLTPGFGFFLSDPPDGIYGVLNGFDGNGPGVITVAQDVTLPLDFGFLTFDYRAAWDLATFGALQNRTFQITIRPAGGGPPSQTIPILTAITGTVVFDTGNLIGLADLSAYAGQSIRLGFEWIVPEDLTGPAFFQLDNVSVGGPDLVAQMKTVPDKETIFLGHPLTYEIDVLAAGDFTGIFLTDTLPHNFYLETVSTTQGVCHEPAAVEVVCSLGDLMFGNTATVQLVGTVVGVGEAVNMALISANEDEENLANNTVSITQTIASNAGLFGSTVAGEVIYIDTNSGQGSYIGTLPVGLTEIEYDNSNQRGFVQASDGSFFGYEIDIFSGEVITGPILNGGAYNGLEYVGDTAYGTVISVSSGPSELRTIDLFSGTSTLIGSTGVGPVAGLAYDEESGTMFGVGGGGITATNFYTIDLVSGSASLVGSTGMRAGGLQFGPDGKLYGASSNDNANPGSLFEIDPETGAATLIGPTGFNRISGLTLVEGTDINLEKTAAADPVFINQEMTYHLQVMNHGPMMAPEIMVTDTLPLSVTYVSATPSQGSCNEANGVVVCDLGDLDNGLQAIITLTVIPTSTGALTNVATVSTTIWESYTSNNMVSLTTTVEMNILHLPIIKSDD